MTIPPFLLWPTVIEQLYYWTRIKEHWSAGPWLGGIFIRVHLFLVLTFSLISLDCNNTGHSAPVAREHIPGREVLVCPPALRVGLHVEHREHAPVGQVDDAAHTRPWAGPRPKPGGCRGYLVRPERYLNLPLFLMSCTVDWLRERPDCTSQGCFKLKLKSFSLKVCNHVTNCTIIGVCLYKSILFQSPYLKFSEKLNDQSCVSYTV